MAPLLAERPSGVDAINEFIGVDEAPESGQDATLPHGFHEMRMNFIVL